MAAKKTKTELVQELETLTIQELVNLIRNGEATASHLAVARGILNDNKTLLLMADQDSPLTELTDILPFDEAANG